jgi:hypothetical protein
MLGEMGTATAQGEDLVCSENNIKERNETYIPK